MKPKKGTLSTQEVAYDYLKFENHVFKIVEDIPGIMVED